MYSMTNLTQLLYRNNNDNNKNEGIEWNKVDTDDALLQQEDDHMKSHYTRELSWINAIIFPETP